MILKKFISYFKWNSKENKTDNFNLRVMHGINKISILMFLICIIVMILRFFIL